MFTVPQEGSFNAMQTAERAMFLTTFAQPALQLSAEKPKRNAVEDQRCVG